MTKKINNPKGKGRFDERVTVERINVNRYRVVMDGAELGVVYRRARWVTAWTATGSREKYSRKQAIDFLIFNKLAQSQTP